MANIEPKLNLNKTPSIVESNSLVFAKNIRLDIDKSIHKDYGIIPMNIKVSKDKNSYTKVAYLVSRIISDIKKNIDIELESNKYVKDVVTKLGKLPTTFSIVGVIPNNNEFFIFLKGKYAESFLAPKVDCSFIIRYDEKEDVFYPCNCNWNYSGGVITGNVMTNLLNEKILNIGESLEGKLIPLKCINLNKSSINDEERLYTQAPPIPITNLLYYNLFSYNIPNGVYQFFVRYKIRDNFYTNWFPASKEFFSGNTNTKDTSFGTVKYVNTHRDSNESFIFKVEHLFKDKITNYESFQIGFICSHDDAIVAREWKHFKFDVEYIYFDYEAKDTYEIEVTDLLKNVFQIYNVKNITSFKNKLYISNYKETDFNEQNFQDLANEVIVGTKVVVKGGGGEGYNRYPLITEEYSSRGTLITGFDVGKEGLNNIFNNDSPDAYNQGKLMYDIFTYPNYNSTGTWYEHEDSINYGIYEAIMNPENENKHRSYNFELYGLTVKGEKYSIEEAKQNFKDKNSNYKNFVFDNALSKVISYTNENIKIDNDSPSITAEYAIYEAVGAIRFMTYKCTFLDRNFNKVNSINVTVKRNVTYEEWTELESEDDWLGEEGTEKRQDTNTGKWYSVRTLTGIYDQLITIKITADIKKLNIGKSDYFTKYTTLIPYQKYKFYIHYVKDNGEITNGYYCNGPYAGIKIIRYRREVDAIIHPVFKNIKLPEGYISCFFSIVRCENIVSTVYNIDYTDHVDYGGNVPAQANCLDLNLGLVYGYENITIKQGHRYRNTDGTHRGFYFKTNYDQTGYVDDENPETSGKDPITPTEGDIDEMQTTSGRYYYSSDTSDIRYFGADGIITIPKDDEIVGEINENRNISKELVAYLINDYVIPESEDIQLIKCTPFINPNILKTETKNNNKINVFDDYSDMDLLGYVCGIGALDRQRTCKYYTDGSNVFVKEGTSTEGDFRLAELDNKINDANYRTILAVKCINTPTKYIYSNYNLNYLTLYEDPVENIKTYYVKNVTGDTSGSDKYDTDHPKGIVLRLLKSAIMSVVYDFPSMYKSYTRKTYSVYKDNEVTVFNNTIRASKLEEDEISINIYKFDPTDYYNVPTNRGSIVNLFSVGDSILVHTEDSMFRFSGSNTLQSSEGEIQPSESNVFDTGVSEVFGSDFGFAGLKNKDNAIVTEPGYIFYDADSNIIYLYSGQGQIQKISDSIEKLFRRAEIDSVKFANDYYNNRFFVCIKFINYNNENNSIIYDYVTLSYNFLEGVKSFVSLHDFKFDKAFNTKTKCYFLDEDKNNIFTVSKESKGYYGKLYTDGSIYPQSISSNKVPNKPTLTYTSYDSIIDIIVNDNYETIKTLNAVNWVGHTIKSEFSDSKDNNTAYNNMAEDANDEFSCKQMLIYSDTCMSNVLNLDKKKANESMDLYKYPFFNQGIWTFNYFRNVLNSKGHLNNYSGDNNSLIEGKYFIIRFIFDKDFKLEALSLNYNRKL